jgi:predicted CXXCH cytochrome family protein
MMGMMRQQEVPGLLHRDESKHGRILRVTKRLAIVGAFTSVLWAFGAAAPASADNGPHMQGAGALADGCAGCHRVHTAKASKILKQAQPGLCYTCHGTGGQGATTDVQNGVAFSAADRTTKAGALRGGGFDYALINSSAPTGQQASYSNAAGVVPVQALTTVSATTSSHTVDGTTSVTAWGNGPISATSNAGKAITLTCGSCHDPHGNGNFRILKPVPDQSGGVATVIADSPAATAKVYTTANYWKVEDATAPAYIANVSAWCTTCHTRYNAPSASGSVNSGDAVFAYRHKSNDNTQGGASCIQCHVSHGSNAKTGAFSGVVGNPVGAGTAGDSKLLRIDNRGTCQMCHNK